MSRVYSRLCNLDKLCKRAPPLGEVPTSEALVKRTFKVALPALAESFLIAIVGIVDTYMVSGLGDYAIAAVGLTTQPKFLALTLFLALSSAVSALVARRRGEGKQQEASRILQMAIILTLGFTLVFTVAGYLLAEPAMHLMGSMPDTHGAATQYFRIIMLGTVFNTITIVINAAQRGIGNTSIAMKTNVVANLINLVLNFLLIEGRFGFPRLEVRGAAIATVIGTVAAMLMALRSVVRPDGYLSLVRGFKLRLDRAVLRSLGKLGAPTLIEQLFMRFGFIVYFMLIARLGTEAMSAHSIGMNFIHISFSFADGLSVACVALVGRSLGEKRQDMALYYSSICQRMGLISSCLVAALYIPFGRALYALFSDSPGVQGYGSQLMPLIAVIVFVQIAMMIYMSSLRAAGDVRFVAAVSFVCIGIFRPLLGWLLCYPLGLGLFGAWVGMLIDQMIRLVLSYLRYKGGKWLKIVI